MGGAAFTIGVILIFINLREFIHRLQGRQTVMAHMLWLSDGQAIIFSGTLVLIYLTGLVLLTRFFITRNRLSTIVVAVSIFLVFILETALSMTVLLKKFV
jgi:hypothetical protein